MQWLVSNTQESGEMRGFAGEIIDVKYILCVPEIPGYKELPLKEI